MKNIFLIFSLLFCMDSFSQNEEEKDSIIQFINCPAEFVGGSSELIKYISKNFDYSAIDTSKFQYGKIYLTFYVETDGTVTEMKAVNYQKENICLENRSPLAEMPKWKPACDENGPIRENQTLLINVDP